MALIDRSASGVPLDLPAVEASGSLVLHAIRWAWPPPGARPGCSLEPTMQHWPFCSNMGASLAHAVHHSLSFAWPEAISLQRRCAA